MSDALEVRDLVVTAGSLTILDGVSLLVPGGRILAVVGPNGAGKTTLLDAVSGIAQGQNGKVALDGITDGAKSGRPRPGVGRVFQGSPLPETLTVGEVAALVASNRERAGDLLASFGLQQFESLFVSELSTGMRRILDIAIATVGKPRVLLLDEPSSGLAQSEIEHLAAVISGWRDSSGAAVILVEHDAWLVRAVADEVTVMDSGRIVARGAPDEVLGAIRSQLKPRLRNPSDPGFKDSLGRVAEGAVQRAPIARTVSTWTMMRLGLRELAAGMGSVLLLGVLNRVLKVELGVSLGVVAAILASYNLAAPFALAVGHRSDRYPIFGRRRVPYIIGGSVVAGIAVAAAPHVAGQLVGGITAFAVVTTVALFIAMGFGMYGSGAVFLALLADIVPERERAHAISVVYIMLMVGVMAGVGLTVGVIEEDAGNLGTLFLIAGILIIVLTTIAVWGKEPKLTRVSESEKSVAYVPFSQALKNIASMRQARLFFAFSTVSVIFLLLQQSVLEPYGGDVLGLSIRATSAFNAVMFVGIIVGMWFAGRPIAARVGHKQIARVGLYMGVVAFASLAGAAAAGSAPPSWLAILGVGIATGFFTIAGLALMMGMVDPRRTAMFMGIWTVGRAVADIVAVAGGGIVFEITRRITDADASSYATVFALEAIGLVLCLPILSRVDPKRFRLEAGMSAS